MSSARVLYHMVRADFLERVRRYSFLLTLGFAVYLGYAVYSGQVTVQLDKYSGVSNSAWLGSVVALVASVWLSLIGFYVVKNSIQRDRQTRVGQILATTPMSKGFYTLSKALSNFAVLALMVLILAIAALVIQLVNGADMHIDAFALLAPIIVFGLSAVAVTAALAVFFESLPGLRGGVGNVFYFFLWTALLTLGATSITANPDATHANPFTDFTGIATVMGQMQAHVHQLDPLYGGGASFSVGGLNPTTKVFLWQGLHWSSAIILGRIWWAMIALAFGLLAALFFDRFDPSRLSIAGAKKSKSKTITDVASQSSANAYASMRATTQLTPLRQDRTSRIAHFRFSALVVSELRLMLRGHGWWWYLVAAGLFVGCLTSPIQAARTGVVCAAWIWPILVWSQMGTRELQFNTASLIFSAPHAAARQLAATYVAGVSVAALTGGGLGLHLLFTEDFAALDAWAAGALFIPAMALALGVLTDSRKPFEALYTAWWYIGPLHHIRRLDFMGTTPQSSMPIGYMVAAAILVLIAYSWRRMRLAHV
jgi:hypothetical protein